MFELLNVVVPLPSSKSPVTLIFVDSNVPNDAIPFLLITFKLILSDVVVPFTLKYPSIVIVLVLAFLISRLLKQAELLSK